MKVMDIGSCILTLVAVMHLQLYSPGRDSGVPDDMEAIMRICGADSPELVDEYEFERLSSFMVRPLEINLVSGSRLVASGLFTQYQIASLMDYRSRNGDILSLSELAAVDGFSVDRAEALAPFVSLASDASPGRSSGKPAGVSNSFTVRGSSRRTGEEGGYAYGMKYRLDAAGRFQLGLSLNRAYSGKEDWPEGGSFYLAYSGRKHLGKVVIGDYNLRYGQGLALWNGFRMSSLSSPESFYLRPSGISPYWSYTGNGSNRGIAADFNIGRFVISSSVAVNGLRERMYGDKDAGLSLMPVMNVAWYGRSAQVSLTGYVESPDIAQELKTVDGRERSPAAGGCSADFRCCVKGIDLFGEAALDAMEMKVSAIAGTVFPASENLVLASRVTYSQEEYGFAAGGRFSAGERVQLKGRTGFGSSVYRHSGNFSVEALYFPEPEYGSVGPGMQLKLLLNYAVQLTRSVSLAARLSERLRNGTERNRTDMRLDLEYSSGDWMATFRINGLYNKELAVLSYMEGGWRPDWMSVYVRAGIFRIDNWQDRIYAYERDAPGNFNVPAYYGRGCWGAVTVGFRLVKRFRAYLRFSTMQYPWKQSSATSERFGKTECRVLLTFSL